MTSAYTDLDAAVGLETVYLPQHDSHLLIDVMEEAGLANGARVADLCTGSGAVAIAASQCGARAVTAFDDSAGAVACARRNALISGADVAVHLGSWARAVEFDPYDLVVCNPPYVPHDPAMGDAALPPHVGPAHAWDAGHDGRLVLDPLCAAAPGLLADGGTLLLVHSEFADPDETLAALTRVGLVAKIAARQWVPFGPVLSSRAEWLEDTGRLERGRRREELIVIRADMP